MPTTRKKVIKAVYKDEESEGEIGDFSDSGSEAQISEQSSSDEEELDENRSSADEFDNSSSTSKKKKGKSAPVKRKPKFAKAFLSKINKQMLTAESDVIDAAPVVFNIKDLTDDDKLLPSVLNLSESDSSDDDTPKAPAKKKHTAIPYPIPEQEEESDSGEKNEYRDVWSTNVHDNSAEIAKKAFMHLEQHKNTIEETKASLQSYISKNNIVQGKESNVTDLLKLGEDVTPQISPIKKKTRVKKVRADSDSELEDWEEVKESKSIPQQGLQLIVELPDSVCRKSKKIDVEMMMRRKINRVKKEHQVFMHKVHVLCWLGHGNYVSRILNDQEIMAAVLAMVPKGCYPEDRLNMKYVEQITSWYKDKLTLKQDKYENKFRPKAPPLKNILLDQIKNRVVTAKKYSVLIFVAMLRALGLQCRVMFNFVTLPLKPPSSELCSLATKSKDDKTKVNDNKGNEDKQPKVEDKKVGKTKPVKTKAKASNIAKVKSSEKLPQMDGNDDSYLSSDSVFENLMQVDGNDDNYISSYSDFENIMQVDGNDDAIATKTRSMRSARAKKLEATTDMNAKEQEGVSPPKRSKKDSSPAKDTIKNKEYKSQESSKSPKRSNVSKSKGNNIEIEAKQIKNEKVETLKSPKSLSLKKPALNDSQGKNPKSDNEKLTEKLLSPRKTRSNRNKSTTTKTATSYKNNKDQMKKQLNPPEIVVTDENKAQVQSKYFEDCESVKNEPKGRPTRKRSHTGHTATVTGTQKSDEKLKDTKPKARAKSAPGNDLEKSKYFDSDFESKKSKLNSQQLKKQEKIEDSQRVSHRDLGKAKSKPKNDVTGDLVDIIKTRIKYSKEDAKKGIVKGKLKEESDDDSDYLPVEEPKRPNSESEDDFKPTKISPKAPRPSTSKKVDRRVLSSDDDTTKKNKLDVWCEVFVEELEQWISIDVVNGKVHCTNLLYTNATHPVCYIIGWDNNNYLKDLTRRYVPHWNTVTRKQRAEPEWWNTAVQPWLGPKTARDREEDDSLDRMQMEAPLPKSIGEYKNHPLYALKRHLLKFEAIYPPDAATLGFVRNEPVYARECVYTCRSRDTWLKEAKVVKLGENPYKVVKARPKWDKLSNKVITDKPLEVFGPWQVQDYEPPVAENGRVPRNAYGNVELFKDCMLPKGTVHIKLPGLNKVARKLNIDCAPAMTGFDFNGGWSHPVYDGFVVCKEFEEIITDAWIKDQEEQERREREKVEIRVYGNWKKLIKGLLIRERLKHKYGFEKPSASQNAKKPNGPRLVVKRK